PGRSGLDVLRQLKDERPKLPVLVLSIHSENEYGVRALRAGASGYLNKEALPEQLLQAINKVLKGGVYVSDSLAERLAMDLTRKSTLLPHETLTDREYEVMRLIAAGMTSGEIASKLCLSVKTISTFRAHLLQKTGMRNNAAIMHYAIKHKLVD
ncbi:MAG: response regulator transcription factor, partial [Deltaproteobacteria bacterium]|nr:response regulator transcription factor [Deltaproteobacteria bacterium]